MSASYLIAGCRTPIGKFLGALSSVAAPRLGAVAVGEAVRRAVQEAGLPLLFKPLKPLALKSVLDRLLAASRVRPAVPDFTQMSD